MEKDTKMLLAMIEDKIRICEKKYETMHTSFLDMQQIAAAAELCKRNPDVILLRELPDGTYIDAAPDGSGRVRALFFGGYPDAERRALFLLPEYSPLSEVAPGLEAGGTEAGGMAEEEERRAPFGRSAASGSPAGAGASPLCALRASARAGSRRLTHRDYLGSLLSLGIKRELTGDILVRENGADIIIVRDIADFLLANYEKAGRTSLSLSVHELSELDLGEIKTEEKRVTVASLRLDSLISAAFGFSRVKAQEAIKSGIVFVNSRVESRPDFLLKEGDKMVLRGHGKTVLREVLGQSKKDRTFVTLERYL